MGAGATEGARTVTGQIRRGRSRASAKKAGSGFEKLVADYLARVVDDRIERRTRNGAQDRGDISGIRHMGQRVVIECKNTARVNLAGWAAEAETERGNDDALVGVVVHKRHGTTDPGSQWVSMTLADLAALLNGHREDTP